ncbi:hypothetical protein CJ309_001284 [Escherichia coli]|nr:hypothetical protein [Escherichia coli]
MMNMKKSGPDKEPPYITTNRCHTCKHGIINYATLATGRQCNHPLGSMPRRFSSALANSLNQLPSVRPSEVAASLTCWRSSLLILIWKVGDHPSPRGDLSRFNVDMYVRNSYYHCCYVRTISVGTVKSKTPYSWSSNGASNHKHYICRDDSMTDITKSAPLPERPCEQLTCCAVCTCEIKHEHDSRYQAGGQGYQPGGRFLPDLRRRGHFAKKSSMANLSGLEDKKGFVFSTLDNSASSRSMVFSCLCRMISSSCVCVSCFGDSVLLVIVCTCKAMRRSTSHHGADSFYPLGSMPRRFSSVRPNSLSQLARLMPSLCASLSNCSFSSGEIRILNCGDCPSPLGLLSRLIVDKWSPIELAFLLLGDHLNTRALKKAKPRKCHYHSQGF